MSRRILLIVLGMIGALVMPSAVYAADGPPHIFYVYMEMENQTDLVQIDTETETLTKVMSLDLEWRDGRAIDEWKPLPVTVEDFLPAVEWQAFQRNFRAVPYEYRERIWNEMTAADLNTRLEMIWEAKPDVLLLYRRFSKCYSMTGPDSWCYGMTQFSLFEIESGEERVIWTLPFHQEVNIDGEPCFTDILYENFSGRVPVDQVLIHPTRDLIAVRFHSYGGRGCSDRLFLIDYALEIPEVTEFSDVRSMAWSPDGTQLAYIEACTPYRDHIPYRRFACTSAYGIIDLISMTIVFFKEAMVDYESWVAWPSETTLVYLSRDTENWRSSLVWYDMIADVEQSFPLPVGYPIFSVLTLRDADSQVILGNGSDTLNSYTNILFNETPGVWTILPEHILWSRESGVHSDYAVLLDGNVAVNAVRLIDADLNRYPLYDLFAKYRDRYGATEMVFAFLGVERP